MENIKICFAASSGGHTSEIMQLQELQKKYDHFFVTEQAANTFPGKTVYYLKQINRKELKSILYFFYLFILSWKFLKKENKYF